MDIKNNNNQHPINEQSLPSRQTSMTSGHTSERKDSESTCSSTGSTDTGFLDSPPLEAKETTRHVQLKPDGNKVLNVHLDMHEFRPHEIKISKGKNKLDVSAYHEERGKHFVSKMTFEQHYKLPPNKRLTKLETTIDQSGTLMVKGSLKPVQNVTFAKEEH